MGSLGRLRRSGESAPCTAGAWLRNSLPQRIAVPWARSAPWFSRRRPQCRASRRLPSAGLGAEESSVRVAATRIPWNRITQSSRFHKSNGLHPWRELLRKYPSSDSIGWGGRCYRMPYSVYYRSHRANNPRLPRSIAASSLRATTTGTFPQCTLAHKTRLASPQLPPTANENALCK